MPLPSFLSSSAVPYPPEAGAHQLKSHQTKALSVPLAARHPQESPLPPVSVMPKPKQKASARSSSERETGRNSRGCRTAPRPHSRVLARHMRQSPFGKDGRPWTRTIVVRPLGPTHAFWHDTCVRVPSARMGGRGRGRSRKAPIMQGGGIKKGIPPRATRAHPAKTLPGSEGEQGTY